MKRIYLVLAFLLVALLAFAGCVAPVAAPVGTADTATDDTAADEPVELEIFHFKVDLEQEWNEYTDAYMEQHPNVAISTEIIGGGTQWLPVLKAKFAADEGPDIFIVEGPAQAEVFSDYLSDLSDEPWVSRAVPSARDGLTIDGKVMGMPVNLEGYGYIYNKDIFEEAGVTERPQTLDELRAAAEKIAAAGYIPFGTGYGIWWVNGLHLMNIPFAQQEDPQAFIEAVYAGDEDLASNPQFIALQELVDLTLEYGEQNPLTTEKDKQTELFVSSQAAMIQQGNWREKEVIEADPDMGIGLLPIPLGNDPEMSDRLPVGVPFYFVVNSDSPEAEQLAAREFLNELVSSDLGKEYLVDVFGFIPAYTDIEAVGLGGVSADILDYASQDKAIPWMFGQFPDGSPREMSDALQRYMAGEADWETTLQTLDDTWDRLTE